MPIEKINPETLLRMKSIGKKICAVVAYSYTMARRSDEAGVDVILVGDSATRVFSGLSNHGFMNIEQMLYHTQAVSRACQHAWVMADFPQETIKAGVDIAVKDAKILIEEGKADSVKVEDTSENAIRIVEAVAKAGIPVVGHFSMMDVTDARVLSQPASSTEESLKKAMIAFGKRMESAGSCALLLSKIDSTIASEITQQVKIPAIGIGSGPGCDGQILVLEDLLGLTYRDHPYYVKQYAQLGQSAMDAIGQYISEIRSGAYPDKSHSKPTNKNNPKTE